MAATVSRSVQTGQSNAVSGGTIPSALFIPADVPDWTKKQKRTDTPFLSKIGRGQPLAKPNPTRQWGWGSPDPIDTTITEPISDTTSTTFTFASTAGMSLGDRLLIDDEEIRVTSITSSTVAECSRGFAGTTAATHLDNATVIIMGPVILEGADDPASPITQGEIDSNYFGIMTFTWTLTQRAKVTPTYEYKQANRDQAELRKKMEDTAPLRLELTLMLGSKAQGSATSPSAMGGIRQSSYITTRTSLSSAPLTELDFNNNLQTVHNLVGPSLMPKVVMGSPFMMRVISSWFADRIRADQSDKKMNSGVITSVETWFGTMTLLPNYLMSTIAPNRVYVFDPDKIDLVPYASSTGWQTGLLSTQGWYNKGYLRGDFSSVWRDPDGRLELYALSTTAADYPGLA